MRRCFALISAIVLAASAVNPVSATTLTEEQEGFIVSNCSSIRHQLSKKVQPDSSRYYEYLSAQYENIDAYLMKNLNLRLVNNNATDATVADQQATFKSERQRFKNDYIGFMQELEALVKIDCRTEPQAFYEKLQLVRLKREDITKSMSRLRDIINEHRDTIAKMREELAK